MASAHVLRYYGSVARIAVFERYNDAARRVVVLAQEEARMLQHNYIAADHVLLAVIHQNGDAAAALEVLGCSGAEVRAAVIEKIGVGGTAPAGHIPFTPDTKKVLELALREALLLGDEYIGDEHILLGLLRHGGGPGVEELNRRGISLSAVRGTLESEQPLDQLGRTFYCYTEDGSTVYPSAEDAVADRGDTELQRVGVTLRPGEYFAVVRDDHRVSGTDNFLDYEPAFHAARTEEGAGVAIVTPVSTEVAALSEHGQRIRIGFELSWTQRSLDPKPVTSS